MRLMLRLQSVHVPRFQRLNLSETQGGGGGGTGGGGVIPERQISDHRSGVARRHKKRQLGFSCCLT